MFAFYASLIGQAFGGARVKEVERALRYPDRMNFGEKWANFNVVVEMDRN